MIIVCSPMPDIDPNELVDTGANEHPEAILDLPVGQLRSEVLEAKLNPSVLTNYKTSK